MRPLPVKTILLCVLTLVGAPVHALEDLGDDYLSDEVAQNGITLKVMLPDFDGAGAGTDLGMSIGQTIWHDSDGAAAAGPSPAFLTPGAVVRGSGNASDFMSLTMAAGTLITFQIDTTGDVQTSVANSQPSLNISVAIPAFQWRSGNLYVARSNGTASPISDQTAAIMNSTVTSVGALTANIQLGFQDQGHLAVMNTTIVNGISMTGYSLNDVNSGGSISIPTITLSDYGASNDLHVNLGVGIKLTGLVIDVAQLGDSVNGLDVNMAGFKLGSAATPALGGIDLVGVNLANTSVRISGH